MMTRKDYVATAEILKYMSDKVHPALFSKVVVDFALMFAKDNPKFDTQIFYKAGGYHIPNYSSK